MSDPLSLVIYFFGSGLAFFTGAGLIAVGVGISQTCERRWLMLARNLAVIVGGMFIALSAIPLDWWLYAFLGIATCGWLALEWFLPHTHLKTLLGARLCVLMVWATAVALELPHHITPTLPALGNPTLFLIGDSVSAGMSDADKATWPRILARTRNIDVRDLSRMGATVGSALKQAERIGDDEGLVLLEIGGNDVLGSTTADQFEDRLEELLTAVCRPARTVVMVELPLPPFCNRFGMIQRRLARDYDVPLIPRRVLVSVLTTNGATVDGIHLTRAGHEQMAEMMWNIVRPAYRAAQ
jgi:acyl-CoA thioesterase-1